jgi:hypothetical protein
MGKLSRLIVFIAASFVVLGIAGAANADPCLVIYPDVPCVYHYDINEYYTVGPGHPLYDPMYDRGGEVLIDINWDTIGYSVYQAPNLVGFTPSTDEKEGYFFLDKDFTLIIDGFSNVPTTYVNILLKFDNVVPEGCVPTITIDGNPVTGDTYLVGDLVVSTPTPTGEYSDTIELMVSWSGCYGLHFWAFSDENYNGILDGEECFTAYSHDTTIGVEETTWGAIKSIYK